MTVEPQLVVPEVSKKEQENFIPSQRAFSLIDLNVIVNNVAYLKSFGCEVAPAVKANAYGVGAVQVVQKLYEKSIREFFVAYFEEGILLRQKVPGNYIIYILNDIKHHTLEDYQEHRLIPVLYDIDSINYWRKTGQSYPCVVHFNTGMHRTGAPINTSLHDLNVILIMSHLCASELKDEPMNKHQLELFKTINAPSKIRKSLANSGGIFLGSEYHFDLARPGIACYGFDNFGHTAIQNCMKIFAPILQIDRVEKGHIGYNMTHTVNQPTMVATLGIGYADGVPRDVTYVKFGPHKASILGRISMDLITVDITHIPENLWMQPAFISEQWPGFSYQYALKLGERIKRVYI